ncbi:MAG TPA: outer membrane lipoprotein carrier protein LolA [Turneriella sp.]|nr:outer membrane lipoprotein carrier protein LolA [Turneriella sp.]
MPFNSMAYKKETFFIRYIRRIEQRKFCRIFSVAIFSFVLTTSLHADAAYESLKNNVKGFYSSFRANFTISSGSGMQSGKIMYQYPGKLRIETSTGVIATNGQHLWVHNKSSPLCARQDVGGVGGGLLGILGSYEGTVQGSTYIFKKKGAHFDEIVVQTGGGTVRSVRMKHGDETITYTFSGMAIDTGISGAMFNYRPSGATIVENPLNN